MDEGTKFPTSGSVTVGGTITHSKRISDDDLETILLAREINDAAEKLAGTGDAVGWATVIPHPVYGVSIGFEPFTASYCPDDDDLQKDDDSDPVSVRDYVLEQMYRNAQNVIEVVRELRGQRREDPGPCPPGVQVACSRVPTVELCSACRKKYDFETPADRLREKINDPQYEAETLALCADGADATGIAKSRRPARVLDEVAEAVARRAATEIEDKILGDLDEPNRAAAEAHRKMLDGAQVAIVGKLECPAGMERCELHRDCNGLEVTADNFPPYYDGCAGLVVLKSKLVHLVVTVDGINIPIDWPNDQPLAGLRNRALEIFKNTGRPFDDWEIKNATGNRIRPDATIKEIDSICESSNLFLNLKDGRRNE
jgi:hypothetical protein